MRLVIFTHKKINEIQDEIKDIFKPINSKKDYKKTQKRLKLEKEQPFTKNEIQSAGKLKGLSQDPHLYLNWSYEQYRLNLETNPWEILNFFLTNKRNKKSLHYLLSQQDLISDINLENYMLREYALITIDFTLTQNGFENQKKVFLFIQITELFFGFLKQLKNHLDDQTYNDIKKIKDLKIKFLQKESIHEYLLKISHNLLFVDPKYCLLDEDMIFEKYNKQAIEDFYNHLSIKNVVIMTSNQKYEVGKCSDLKDTEFLQNMMVSKSNDNIMNYEYDVTKISEDFVKSLENPDDLDLDFKIPIEYLPKDFSMLGNVQKEQKFSNIPILLLKNNMEEHWMLSANWFKIPKIVISIQFQSPFSWKTPKDLVQTKIFQKIISQHLKQSMDFLFSTEQSIALESNQYGISIELESFTDTILQNIEKMMSELKSLKIDENDFNKIKQDQQAIFENQKTDSTTEKLRDYFQEQLLQNEFTTAQMLEDIGSIDFESILEFQKSFFKSFYLKTFSTGNIDADLNLIVVSKIQSQLKYKQPNSDDIMKFQKIKNIRNKQITIQMIDNDDQNTNNGIVNYYQFGFQTTMKQLALFNMVNSILDTITFNYLRGDKQLGYVANTDIMNVQNIIGIQVFVVGDKSMPEQVDKYIEIVLKKGLEKIEKMKKEDFKDLQDSLEQGYQKKAQNMDEFHSKFWSRILNGRYDLKRSENLYKLNKTLQIKDLQYFYKQYFQKLSGKLSLQLVCQKCQKNESKFDEKEQTLRKYDDKVTSTDDLTFFKNQIKPYKGLFDAEYDKKQMTQRIQNFSKKIRKQKLTTRTKQNKLFMRQNNYSNPLIRKLFKLNDPLLN